jgi:hypothetical protein
VYGEASNTGVWGKGSRYGVYGDINPGGIAAGYFAGPVFAASYGSTSDIRLKTNIAAANYGLAAVMRFDPFTYDLIGQEDGRHIGLIAQDVREIVPEVVHEITTPEGEATLVLNYTELIPVLINAIQEQQAQIEALSGRPHAANGERHGANGIDSTGSILWLFMLIGPAFLAGAAWQGRRARRPGHRG